MKKGIIVSFVFMFIGIAGSSAPANSNDKILFVFPDDVEIAINDYIEKYSDQGDFRFVLTLYKEKDKTYKIYVNLFHVDNQAGKLYWEQLTNRFAVINNKEYPLLFDYDYDFSIRKPTEIGEYSKRDGRVLRTIPINDGFYVRFSKSGLCGESD